MDGQDGGDFGFRVAPCRLGGVVTDESFARPN